MIGADEGERCGRGDCAGIIRFPPIENCRCFISPPCSACVDNPLTCDECWAEPAAEQAEDFKAAIESMACVFHCAKCGAATDLACVDAADTRCYDCCEDHDYRGYRDTDCDGYNCLQCGKPAPADWHTDSPEDYL